MAANKMTPEDLKAIKNRVGGGKKLRKDGTVGRIAVHMSTCGLASGAQNIMDRLLQEISECGRSDIAIGRTGCIGLGNREPMGTGELLGRGAGFYTRAR